MAALGVQAEVLDSGCCGLAGNFGFERGHYQVSQACGERVLFPAIRADRAASVVADGYSCRTQIRQSTDAAPVHLAHLAAAVLAPHQGWAEEAELERAGVSHQLLDGGACSAVIHPWSSSSTNCTAEQAVYTMPSWQTNHLGS